MSFYIKLLIRLNHHFAFTSSFIILCQSISKKTDKGLSVIFAILSSSLDMDVEVAVARSGCCHAY